MVAADDFSRRFSMRSANLMWFLGAGASAAGGIPTAWDMIWDFKQRLYVSQKRVSVKSVADTSSPYIQKELQLYIDSVGSFPAADTPEEYAALFEAAFPSENDRRSYIDSKLKGAKPSYGHIALATLMNNDKARIVWTTNFDPLVADGCAKVYEGTGHLTTVALESAARGFDVINGGRWPVEFKIHGDFRSRKLKNTTDELRHQDATLRQTLIEACSRWGLIVSGYSGRDDSVMDTLEEVLDGPSPFPAGLFWLNRGTGEPLPRVRDLLMKAAAKDIDGGLVVIENFDETLRDLIRLLDGIDTIALDTFASSRRIWSPPPRLSDKRNYPVIRLNALEVKTTPSVCRRIVCTIGGHREVLDAVAAAEVDILATRSKAGVLAFGADVDVRKAFDNFTISDFDLHAIETKRLRYDSQERGLLRQALSRALAREHNLVLRRRHSKDLLSPADVSDATFAPLKKIVQSLTGTVPNHPALIWKEGVEVRLDWADDRLWLLFEPRIIFNDVTDENRTAATSFARERTVRRYNGALNSLMSFWVTLLAANGKELRSLNASAGVDGVFQLSPHTAFSGRAQA